MCYNTFVNQKIWKGAFFRMKKWLSLLLVLCMVIPLTACPSNDGDQKGEGTVDWSEIDNLGDYDFKDETVTISCFEPYAYEVYGAENGSWIEKESYKRNKELEIRFNVNIENDTTNGTATQLDEHYNRVNNAFMNGADEFDLVVMMAYQIGKMVVDSHYCDWRSEVVGCRESIKSGAEWWPESINRDCMINGYQYIAVSDMCLTAMEMCYAVIFNCELESRNNVAKTQIKSIVQNKNGGKSPDFQSMFDVVDEGWWTLDVMYDVVKDFWQPGAGKDASATHDEKDIYGLALGKGTDSDAWPFAFNIHYINNDGISTPQLWDPLNDRRVTDSISQLQQLVQSDGVYSEWGDTYEKRCTFFAEGHALFTLMALEELKLDTMHEMKTNAAFPFGVLPYPKLNRDQKIYQAGSKDHFSLLAVPAWVLDTGAVEDNVRMKRIGYVTEAMSAYNAKKVKTPYYELMVKYGNTHDDDSVRMIDLIMNGRMYDLTIYHYNELRLSTTENDTLGLLYRYMLLHPTQAFSTHWTQYQSTVEYEFDDLITKYNEITQK